MIYKFKCVFCDFLASTRSERIEHEETEHPKESLEFFGRIRMPQMKEKQ